MLREGETILEAFERTYKKFVKSDIGACISINDLREKEENGLSMKDEQRLALHNYEKCRIAELNSALDEEDFHNKYKLLQVMANLRPYQDFLNDRYK